MVQFQARTHAVRLAPIMFGWVSALGGCAQVDALDPQVELAALESESEHEHQHESPQGEDAEAVATLRDASGNLVGTIRFRNAGQASWVTVQARAASGGIRGMHVHANDNPDNGVGCAADPAQPASTHFSSADGHYVHEGSGGHGHHAGDMPALFFTEAGDAAMQFLTDRFVVGDILGRAVILHAGADNYGNIPVGDAPEQYTPNAAAATELTAKTGNAGARYACGVIELAEQ